MQAVNNEKQLLKLSAEGKEAAFAELFNIYSHKLYGFLLRATGSPEQAEDIIQDIFLRLWKDRENLVNIEQFGGYVYRMAQHRVINAMRRMARETLALEELGKTYPSPIPEVEARLAERDVAATVHLALGQLTPKQKLVYTLSREKGLKHDEIAAFLKISPSTVNNHMIEALRQIRQQLNAAPELLTILAIMIVFLP
ncbi:RNA polymerase sigma factor [Chitinophaga lutea]